MNLEAKAADEIDRLKGERDASRAALASLRVALLAMAERWHNCNEGQAPTPRESMRRRCARDLERVARAIPLWGTIKATEAERNSDATLALLGRPLDPSPKETE